LGGGGLAKDKNGLFPFLWAGQIAVFIRVTSGA